MHKTCPYIFWTGLKIWPINFTHFNFCLMALLLHSLSISLTHMHTCRRAHTHTLTHKLHLALAHTHLATKNVEHAQSWFSSFCFRPLSHSHPLAHPCTHTLSLSLSLSLSLFHSHTRISFTFSLFLIHRAIHQIKITISSRTLMQQQVDYHFLSGWTQLRVGILSKTS